MEWEGCWHDRLQFGVIYPRVGVHAGYLWYLLRIAVHVLFSLFTFFFHGICAFPMSLLFSGIVRCIRCSPKDCRLAVSYVWRQMAICVKCMVCVLCKRPYACRVVGLALSSSIIEGLRESHVLGSLLE
jgi:hypothetical protein